MKDLPFFTFMSILVIVLFSDFFNQTNKVQMTVCSLKHEAYTISNNTLMRNKDSDSLCLCKGT